MKEISKDDLPLALRGANPEVKEKFFKNMSSRAAEMLKEDMEAKGPVKVSDIEKAQTEYLESLPEARGRRPHRHCGCRRGDAVVTGMTSPALRR